MEVSALKPSAVPALRGPSGLLRVQSDERLIALVRRGNHRAFEVLVSRYQSRLLAFCRHMLGSREDAEDVLQEVFAAAFNAILADNRAINVRPWLYRIARNRSLNHLRRTTAVGVDSMDVHYAENGISTAEKVLRRESFRQLIGDVHRLPETQRTALLLREIDALSYEQIADAMETTVPAVKSLLVRARISLAEAAEARKVTCEEARLELGEAAEGLAKLSVPVRRHVRECERCRAFRKHLKSNNVALAAMLPVGPLLLLKKLALTKLGSTAGAGGAHVAGASSASAAAGATAAGGASATGSLVTAGASALATKAAAGLAVAAIVTAGTVEAEHATSRPHPHRQPVARVAAPSQPMPEVTRSRAQPVTATTTATTASKHRHAARGASVARKARAAAQGKKTPVKQHSPATAEETPPASSAATAATTTTTAAAGTDTTTTMAKPKPLSSKQQASTPATEVTTETTALPPAANSSAAPTEETAAATAAPQPPPAETGGTEAVTTTTGTTEASPPPPSPADPAGTGTETGTPTETAPPPEATPNTGAVPASASATVPAGGTPAAG